MQDIEPPELVAHVLGSSRQRLLAGDVDLNHFNPLPDALVVQLINGGFPVGESAAANEHMEPLAMVPGKLSRDLEADPPVPAGHEHDLLVRVCHIAVLKPIRVPLRDIIHDELTLLAF